MSQVKYVCISDFHLGAPNSILTAVHPKVRNGKIQPNPEQTSQSLQTFADAIFDFLPALHGKGKRPTLILMGDVLDMGFSPANVVVMAFQRFVEALFPKNKPPLFAKEIIMLPGNHDHNLWQSEKFQHFLNQIEVADSKWLPDFVETTRIMTPPRIVSRLLTEVMHGYPHLKNYSVKMSYPNMGRMNSERIVFLHHGHFIESMYRMISEIGHELFDEKMTNLSASELERVNGTWIDFGWAGLGERGDNAYSLYSLMQDGAALHQFTSSLAQKIQKQIINYLPMSGLPQVKQLELGIAKGLLDVAIGRAAQLERTSYQNVLGGDSLTGLRWYVDHLVRRQFESENKEAMPDDVSFIFGHTHKPFEDQMVLEHFTYPVKIYNTGGWVLDVPQMAVTQGASMVLIDEQLHVASMRLYNDPVNDVMPEVSVNGVGGFPDLNNPLLPFLRERLQEHKSSWHHFSKAAKKDIQKRAELMQDEFFDPMDITQGKIAIAK